MNTVGIDVSKGKSTVTIRQPGDVILMPPRDFHHTKPELDSLVDQILRLEGETKVCMENTGRYYEPIAAHLSASGIFVSAVNPKLIKDYGDGSLRTPKTDKADSDKIARFALDHWSKLRQNNAMDESRNQLKTLNRQFSFYMQHKSAMKNNLISLVDLTFPGANDFFESPARSDGSQKWVDFIDTYWHVDRVRSMPLDAFSEHYRKWCHRHKYNFNADRAKAIYDTSLDMIPVLPKNDTTKHLIKQAVDMLNAASETVESIRAQMNSIAETLPEYPVVMAMNGVGPTLGPQLIAEIGDVTRFEKHSSLTAFAGVDPGPDQSGSRDRKSNPTSKNGSPHLRKTLFQVMDSLIKRKPEDDAVYAFMDKKRSEGKPYLVYMTAGANKFLRIYYARVKEYLNNLNESSET